MRQTSSGKQIIGQVLAGLWALSGCVVAHAGPLCADAMFMCQDGNTFTGTNLRKAIQSKSRARWVLKHCRLTVNSLEPAGCDWRRTLKKRRLYAPPAAATTTAPSGQVASRLPPPPGYRPSATPSFQGALPAGRPMVSQPSQPPPSPVIRQPNRDVRGRYSTTPAPTRLPKVTAADRAPFAAEVRAAAEKYHLPADLIRAVMKVESNYKTDVVSHAGAVGLMQLMPEVARVMGVQDRRDPAQSIMGGARYLRILANRFKGDLVKVLSAYHAGSSRVKRRGGTPYAATDSYVRKVLGVYYALRDR